MTPTTQAQPVPGLADLYEADETAWLEESVRLIRAGRPADLDYENLAEFLESMAKRDRREVESRLIVLLTHLLKWQAQPTDRSKSWRLTVIEQRRQLTMLFRSKTLRNHAGATLGESYRAAVEQAAVETDLPESAFPTDCPVTLDQILTEELP
jgi:hypothetical protein